MSENRIPKETALETSHLEMCLGVIRENIQKYEAEYRERHALVQELFKAINGGDVELYNQLMTAASLEEQAESALRKNNAAAVKPYFGRIDYTDRGSEREECVYIGKNGVFRNKTDILIADWRAPISSVYYENELGAGEYGLPDETHIPIELKLKRTYDIDDGRLLGFYDSDVASNDELLVKYLSRNKDVVLGEIIATIQREQNAIIRETPFANLIVQGVAGSGKTTVAMHRISYLLYNYKERFESNEYCIIGGNDLLLNYITSGLPELDVPNIKHMRMDQLFVRLCGKDWSKKYTVIPPGSDVGARCTREFFLELEIFLQRKRLEIVDCKPLEDPMLGTVLSASGCETLLRENPRFSIDRLLTVLDERVKTRIGFLMSGCDRDDIRAKLKEYQGYYKKRKVKANAAVLYLEFLAAWGNASAGHMSDCAAGRFDLYDASALALIHYRVHQTEPNQEFGLLFMDEAQDFGIGSYYVLKTVLPDTYFTIMGDVSQNINYDTGMNDWDPLIRLFLTGEKDKFLLLQKSYRNTIEISEYAGKILEKASTGQYKITPVIRHGIPVSEESFWSEPEAAERAAELIRGFREKGYDTTAVICRDEEETRNAAKLLSQYLPKEEPVTLQGMSLSAAPSPKGKKDSAGNFPAGNTKESQFQAGTTLLPIPMVKGLEFDTVILWKPRMEQGLKRPDTAKLLYVAATRALHELYVLEC